MNKKRILFCIDSTAYLRHLAPVILRFADSNLYHVDLILFGAKEKLRENTIDLLYAHISNIFRFHANHRKVNSYIQNILALFLLLNPDHTSPQLIYRTPFPSLLKKLFFKARNFSFFSRAAANIAIIAIRSIYKLILYTDPQYIYFLNFFRRNKYDIVFSAPYIFPNSLSVPMQFACKHTGTPLVGQIASWDNLTTKGTWVVKPDLFFVWNTAMKRELSLLHSGIDQITYFHGSPTFESTKNYQSPSTREDFLKHIPLPENSKYILYLCSSPTIGNNNEDKVLIKLVRLFESYGIFELGVHLVIRTHPLLNLQVTDLYNTNNPHVHFFPKSNVSPNMSSDANDAYLSSINYSELVIGQNTSAFLDACLLDIPCITLPEIPSLYDPSKFGHIQLLLDGGFIHQPANDVHLKDLVIDILNHSGDKRNSLRNQFIKDFLYPEEYLPSKLIFDHIHNTF